MRQFNEAYKEDSIVSPLVTELPWSHHLIILGQSKRSKNASPTCKMQSIQNLVLESVRRGKPRIIGFYARSRMSRTNRQTATVFRVSRRRTQM